MSELQNNQNSRREVGGALGYKTKPMKTRIILFALALSVAIPSILILQDWEAGSSQERVAARVASFEAFAKAEYGAALPGLALMANEGSVVAQAKLAFLYERGLVVERDPETAIRWYRAAADQGDKRAKLSLARLLDEEKGPLQDQALASALYEELALSGLSEAALRLAALYFDGAEEIAQDYVVAARWLTRAAKAGNPEAQLRLGLMYRDGLGVPKDIVFAHMWLNLAAARFPAAENHRRLEAIAARDALVPLMSQDELRESLQVAREWQSANS